ncbi:MAG: CNNM domain-containing protein, partial [Lachnospiraceae bacterium]|nr:CNNM domain-containing protein [Lachnospiraceae bacterium]
MDDGSSPLFRLGLFLVFIVINAVVYGFSAAVQNINQVNIQKQANDGSNISKKIIAVIDNPYKFINTIQVISTLIAMLAGIFELNVVVRFLRNSSKGIVGKLADSMAFGAVVYFIGALFIIFVLLSAGVLVPKKLGAKKPEKWAFSLVNIVYVFMVIFTPVTCMISFVTNIILRIFGVDPYE